MSFVGLYTRSWRSDVVVLERSPNPSFLKVAVPVVERVWHCLVRYCAVHWRLNTHATHPPKFARTYGRVLSTHIHPHHRTCNWTSVSVAQTSYSSMRLFTRMELCHISVFHIRQPFVYSVPRGLEPVPWAIMWSLDPARALRKLAHLAIGHRGQAGPRV